MSAVLADVHARLLPLPTTASGVGPTTTRAPQASSFLPGDAALLELVAVVDGEGGSLAWPDAEALTTIFDGQARIIGDPVFTAAGSEGARSMTLPVQLLLAPGQHELGPFQVVLQGDDGAEWDRAEVPPVTVEVASVLTPEDLAALDGAADPGALQQAALAELAPPRGPWALVAPLPTGWLVGGGIAALLLAALLVAWWRRRPRRVLPPRPAEAPEVVALRQLAALEASGLLESGRALAWHVELADILKRYVDARHGVDFIDRTTDEIRRLLSSQLRARTPLGSVREELLATLSACDLVKFARQGATPSDGVRLSGAVRRIIDKGTPRPEPALEQGAA